MNPGERQCQTAVIAERGIVERAESCHEQPPRRQQSGKRLQDRSDVVDMLECIFAQNQIEVSLVIQSSDIRGLESSCRRQLGISAVKRAARKGNPLLVEVDPQHFCGTALGRLDGEGAMSTAEIEHALALKVDRNRQALQPLFVPRQLRAEIGFTQSVLVRGEVLTAPTGRLVAGDSAPRFRHGCLHSFALSVLPSSLNA